MRRLVILGLVALVAGTSVAAATAPPPRARLRGFVCQRALDPAARGLSVAAVMRPVSGTAKMAMRFQLLKRARRHGPAQSIAGPRLKDWITPSDPTLGSQPGDTWILKHPVVDLAAPAFYQLKVGFRWSDASGNVIFRAVRLTPLCFQPELRPDLVIKGITTYPSPTTPGGEVYVATVANRGKTAAGQFNVQLVEGQTTLTDTVAGLAPHARRDVRFTAPACSASAPATITVDPTGMIDDANPANNSMETTCS